MARGEYESQKALAEHLPEHAAVPLAYGTLDLDPSKSFFLTPFLHLDGGDPDPEELARVLGALHRSSTSPTGKYGFHVQTFNGVVPLVNGWCDTWEEWFSRQLRSDIAWERSIAGPDPDFDRVADEFFDKVIPRLLRPLETGGRSIKPTLVHGDIWHGNCQVDSSSNRTIMFDSCCCYAHNECKSLTYTG